jgi:uncharacterized RmlC-like cupin family protein
MKEGHPMTERQKELAVVHPGHDYMGKQGHEFFAGISRQSTGSQALCLHVITIPPATRDKPHMHQDHESAIYILAGQVEGWYGESLQDSFSAKAGDFVYIPRGVPHQPVNASPTEPLLAIIARTDPNEQESVVLLPDPRQD